MLDDYLRDTLNVLSETDLLFQITVGRMVWNKKKKYVSDKSAFGTTKIFVYREATYVRVLKASVKLERSWKTEDRRQKKTEAGSQKLEDGSQKMEVRSWKSEDGSWKSEDGSWQSEDRSWKVGMALTGHHISIQIIVNLTT